MTFQYLYCPAIQHIVIISNEYSTNMAVLKMIDKILDGPRWASIVSPTGHIVSELSLLNAPSATLELLR